jgi:hypothetical protein
MGKERGSTAVERPAHGVLVIMSRCKNALEREFYLRAAAR